MATETKSFGSGKRESHNSDAFYSRFRQPELSTDETVVRDQEFVDSLGAGECLVGDARDMSQIADSSIALVVTSPPYFVGKDYELDAIDLTNEASDKPGNFEEYLQMLAEVFAECYRVLEPGGRIAVNVANLGRKPYRSLSADVSRILSDEIGFLLRGEIIWQKSKTSSGSCAWGSFAKATNPVIRDMTERVIVASKGMFSRAQAPAQREKAGLPHVSTLTNDEFMDATTDVWQIDPESAKRVGHPAPFPVALPERLINMYTFVDDLVLDPFCGVGSTLIAAAKSNRIGIGFDTEADYAQAANERLQKYSDTQQLDLEVTEGYDRAVNAGKKVADMAEDYLRAHNYTLVDDSKARKVAGLTFDALVTDSNGTEQLVLVEGGFLVNKPGLGSIDNVMRVVAHAALADHGQPVLVITAAAPNKNSTSAKALAKATADGLIELVVLN